MPRTSRHRSPGGERRAQSQGHHTTDQLEERGGHKAKDITPPIAWGREAQKEEVFGDILFKAREKAIGNQTSIGTVSKATFWKKILRRRGEHVGFPECVAIICN